MAVRWRRGLYGIRVVGHHFAEDGGVRHKYLHVIARAQLSGAYADVFDHPQLVLDTNRVADSERPFEQQIDPAEEVLEDVLDGQAEGHREGTCHRHEASWIDAQDA